MSSAAPSLLRTWVMGEFSTSEKLLVACRSLREKGFEGIDAYSPYPLHGIEDALGLKKSKVPLIALIGGLTGVFTAYAFQYWFNAVDYPLNVANRPPHSAPAFIPITFELGVLLAALSIFFGLLILSGLPRPHHPVFEVDAFRSASTHAFWISIPLTVHERAGEVEEALKAAGATQTAQVPETHYK